MLKSLYIKNFALIQEQELVLDSGFTVLTGETGAGKSLLLGAIGLILGKRLDTSYIFNPEKKCIVEARFKIVSKTLQKELSSSEDFDLEDDNITIRREASAAGKSRAFINDTPVSLNVLKGVTSQLVDLHGQHENIQLLSREHQLQLLDEFVGLGPQTEEFRQALQSLAALRKDIQQLKDTEARSREQLDYFRFQLEELEEANLNSETDSELEGELELLENAEEVREVLGASIMHLYEGENALYQQLAETIRGIKGIAGSNSTLQEALERLNEANSTLQEVAKDLGNINEGIDLDPERLSELQVRMDLLNRLSIKFSANSIDELIAKREEFFQKVGAHDSVEDQIKTKAKALETGIANLTKLGIALDQARKKAVPALAKSVNQLLQQVGLENATFDIEVSWNETPQGWIQVEGNNLQPLPSGLNKAEFHIRTNPGMPMGPLASVASGGEVSRVMLAIKAALAQKARLSTLIFDEIDTGISGETAKKVAAVMRQLGQNSQVIAITHLPQIAGAGAGHFLIYKEIRNGVTATHLRPLAAEDRITVLAKMISGDTPSESALANARELLQDI